MPNLLEILKVLSPTFSQTNITKLSEIALSILCLSVSVTTRSIGRVSNLSLRTIERFYSQALLPWLLIRVLLFKHFFYKTSILFLLAGDETTQKKAGKSSFGINRFYSSIFGKPIRSVSFLGISLINTQTGKSSILSIKQLIKPEKSDSSSSPAQKKQKQSTIKNKVKSTPKPPGRKKGSKNKPYQEPENLSFQQLKSSLIELLGLLATYCPGLIAPYLVLDAFYSNKHYQKLSKSLNLHLIT